jgi:serine/threonine protein kinase
MSDALVGKVAEVRLRLPHGKGRSAVFPLHADGPTVFGRGTECEHRLPSKFLSRRHFAIVPDGEGFLLFDLGSRNGTFLKDERTRIARLSEGDVIRVGDRILIFEGADASSRCPACGRQVPGSHGRLCLVCRHRFPLLEENGSIGLDGLAIRAPLSARTGVADYAAEMDGRLARLRVLERSVPRRSLTAITRFEHARVLRVLHYRRGSGRTLLVTEPPPRVSLATLVRTRLPAPVSLVKRVMVGVAEALAEAHRHGLHHGRLRPAVVGIDSAGRASLDELGLSDVIPVASEAETDWSTPPERRGSRHRADAVADLYAYGATFYETFTRRPPMPDYAEGKVDATRPLATRRPDLSGRMAFLIGRALASEPRERYRRFEEILADLRD